MRLGTIVAGAVGLGILAAAGLAAAGPEKIAFPADYKTKFVEFNAIDRLDLKGVRYMYANQAALEGAAPGKPVPNGAVLVMETRKAKLDAEGNPMRDAQGRYIPTDEVVSIAVQEKRAGFGTEYPEAKRNGDWEYAMFMPNGQLNDKADHNTCFTCHKTRGAEDFTFVFGHYLAERR